MHLCDITNVVNLKVATSGHIDDVLVPLVGSSSPIRSLRHTWINWDFHITIGEPLRTDITLDQEVVSCKVPILQQARLTRFKCDFETLFIDLAVIGNQDCGELFRQGIAPLIDLFRVDGGESALQSIDNGDLTFKIRIIGSIDKRCNGGAVRGLISLRPRLFLNRLRSGCRDLHSFNVDGVLTIGGGYEGVFVIFTNG